MKGPFVVAVELGGGVLLILGLFTRIVAALQAVVVLGAMVLVHLSNGFFASGGGIEFTLVLATVSSFFVLAGPGWWSVDRVMATRRTGNRVSA